MWIRHISVRHFAGIRSAEVSFDRGLNVLYGPNEIGKSTLVDAMRAGLLLLHGATAARDFEDWHTDQPPRVALTFETEPQRIWRVRKTFGKGADGSSYLEFSRDGKTFTQDAKGRQVDGRIRELLRWGLRPPGGKGSPKAESFLATTLLADQREVAAVLDRSLDEDSDESGKGQLTAALQALVQDPVFRTVVARTQERVDEAFTGTGLRSRRRGSPWRETPSVPKSPRQSANGTAFRVFMPTWTRPIGNCRLPRRRSAPPTRAWNRQPEQNGANATASKPPAIVQYRRPDRSGGSLPHPPLQRIDLDAALGLVADKKYFVLHAPRQTGKTSALLALRDLLNGGQAGDYRCLYANVENAQAMRENVAEAMRTVLAELAFQASVTLGDETLEELCPRSWNGSARPRRCARRWRAGAWRIRVR